MGVLFALAQHDLKRLLAYHSVENIGIITMGLGVGVLGLSSGTPWLAALGFAGALLHVVNHAIFKGLLFLGAGAVLAATGTRDMERLRGGFWLAPRAGGGLLPRRPPRSGRSPPPRGLPGGPFPVRPGGKGAPPPPRDRPRPLLA